MRLSKTEEFTKSQKEIAALAKALVHPARIASFQFLAEQKSCACETLSTNQHLKELKKVGEYEY